MKITTDTIARIQAGRKSKGLNQSQLADLLGLNRSSISKLLSGKTHTIEEPLISQIEHILDIELEARKVDGFRVSSQ